MRGDVIASARDEFARQSWSRQKLLDAAATAAVAWRRLSLIVLHRGQRVVSPLSGDSIDARNHTAVDDDAAAAAGAEDHAEDDRGAGRRAVGRFREREAVGVVGKADRTIEQPRQVVA